MKKQLTAEDLSILREAHVALRGTKDYQKYLMENECKYKRAIDDKFTGWKWIGWNIPYSLDQAVVKKVGENVYIMREQPDGWGCVDRWAVTAEVNELLKIY